MSDTQRWIQPGWDGLPHMGIKSKKHQSRDHGSLRPIKKTWRFTTLTKNIRHNLLRKIDDLRKRESLEQ